MDSNRAKQIMKSSEPVQVLYEGSPVWLENVKVNNMAEVTRIDNQKRIEVPLYMLMEDGPANK